MATPWCLLQSYQLVFTKMKWYLSFFNQCLSLPVPIITAFFPWQMNSFMNVPHASQLCPKTFPFSRFLSELISRLCQLGLLQKIQSWTIHLIYKDNERAQYCAGSGDTRRTVAKLLGIWYNQNQSCFLRLPLVLTFCQLNSETSPAART